MAAKEHPTQKSPSPSADLTQAVAQFYTALNRLFTGELAPMVDVWSHADDVTYMGPTGGYQKGWAAILEVWKEQAAKKLGGKITATQMQVTEGQDIAVTSNYEQGENKNAAIGTQSVSIRVTNIFRKENGVWKMIGHHTDLLPYLVGSTSVIA